MGVEDELKRLNMRQEAMVTAMHGLTDVMEQTRDLVTELMAWLQEPPSSDLSDTLKAIVEALKVQSDQIHIMNGTLGRLPAQLAQAVVASR